MKALLRKIRQILRDRRTRQMLTRIISVTAAIVVFVTTYALVLPAITMEAEAQCGIEAHQHNDSCYSEVLICELEESDGHHHDESCYSTSTVLVCETEEHQHSVDNGCYDEDGNLICEKIEHVHDEDCYEEARELICEIAESEGHQHDESCYQKVLTCGKEVHTHSTACYRDDAASTAATEAAAVASTASTASGSSTASTASTANTASGGVDYEFDDASTASTNAVSVDNSGESSTAASTGATTATAGYVPVLDELNFNTVLDDHTGIYYSHPAAVENNGAATDNEPATVDNSNTAAVEWNRIDKHTELGESDLLRVYLAYTIPAGSLNETNTVARYRMPGNVRLTDEQVEQINSTVNGIAGQYVSMDTLEILDQEMYSRYLGIEAVEGIRTPSDDLNEYLAKNGGQEFISATVKVEDVVNEHTGEYEGQDLVFTFVPYTVLKNQHEYDADGQPTKAGEEVSGWVSFYITTDAVEWIEDGDDEQTAEKTAEVVFVEKDKELGLKEISTKLKLVDKTAVDDEDDSSESSTGEKAEAVSEDTTIGSTDDAAADATVDDHTVDNEGGSQDSTEDAAEASTEEVTKEVNYPAISFDDSITVSAGTLSTDTTVGNEDTASAVSEDTEITVHVEADEDTFPEGTTMVLAAVSDMDAVAEAVEGAMAEAVSEDDTDADVDGEETVDNGSSEQSGQTGAAGQTGKRTLGFHALDISFQDAEGNEIEPLKPIRVSMSSEAIRRAVEDESTAPVVVHIEDPSSSSDGASNGATEDEARDAAVVDTTVYDNAVAGDATVSVEAGEERTADNEDSVDVDALDNSTTETADSDHTVDNDVTADDDHTAVNETTDTTNAGEGVEPGESNAGEASATAKTAESATGASDEAGEAGEVADDNAGMDASGVANTITFESDEFSVYAIVYTVDFHWTVGDKEYSYSITGGSAITLSELLPIVEIVTDDENTEVDEVEAFLADVEGVEFSNPEFVYVEKAEADTTIGAIEDQRELEIQYSAEVDDAAKEEYRNKTVSSGDWALISVQPFESEETLVIRMTDGTVYTIKVTDAQKTDFASLVDGEKYVLYAIANNGDYYALKGDGATVRVQNNNLEELSSDFLWTFHLDTDSTHENGSSYWTHGNYYLDVYNYYYYFFRDYFADPVSYNPGWTPIATLVPAGDGGFYFRDLNPRTSGSYFNGYNLEDFNNNYTYLNFNRYNDIRTIIGPANMSYSDAASIHIYKQGTAYTVKAKTNNDVFGYVQYTHSGSTLQTSSSEPVITLLTEKDENENKTILDNLVAVPAVGYKFTGWTVIQENSWDENEVTDWGTDHTQTDTTIRPTVSGNLTLQANFEPETLYTFTVKTNSSEMGTVGGTDSAGNPVTNQESFESISKVVINGTGRNAYDLTATKKPLYKFVEWQLEDSSGNITTYPNATIPANTINLTEEGMTLTAVFRKKTDTEIDNDDIDALLGDWKEEMTQEFTGVNKTAHVTDYDNRIYEIDLTASSKKWVSERSIALDFITDTSRSMYFPANLEVAGTFDKLSELNTWLSPKNTSEKYYVISDDNSATMYVVYHNGQNWVCKDSSYYYYIKPGSTTSSSNNEISIPNSNDKKLTVANKYLTGTVYKSSVAPTTYRGTSSAKYWSRLDYLAKAVGIATETVYKIDPNASISLTTFNASSTRVGSLDKNEDTVSNAIKNISLAGGTRQDRGLLTSYNGYNYSGNADSVTETGKVASGKGSAFSEGSNNKQTAILISDGAPNFGNNTTGLTWTDITDQADLLKGITDAKGENLILMTLGLSLDFVNTTEQENFNGLASESKYAKNANNGGQIVKAIKDLVESMLSKAELFGTVSDTLDPAFYPVTSEGEPVAEGYYDMYGHSYTPGSNDDTPYYQWTNNNGIWTISYHNQTFRWPETDNEGNITEGGDGWKQAFHVKAKENFLGGNTIETNNGNANFTATHTIRLNDQMQEVAGSKTVIKDKDNVATPIVKDDVPTPHVNVKQLTLDGNKTEWKVYIEKTVNPLPQIKELYNNIKVLEVVDSSTNNMITSNAAMLFTPGTGTEAETFYLKDIISLTDANWDDLIGVNGGDGTVDIPYTGYNHSTGVIRLTLSKDGDYAAYSEHQTSGSTIDVETYVLTAQYVPYTVSKMTQNDDDGGTYHTTANESPGTEQQDGRPCDNTHTVDLFVRGLSITKTDETFHNELTGAEFTFYRPATDEEKNTTDEDEQAKLKTFDGNVYYPYTELSFDDSGTQFINGIKCYGESVTFYLEETKAPDGYNMLESPIKAELTITNAYTPMPLVDGVVPTATAPSSGLYNWEQQAKLELIASSGLMRTTGAYDPNDPSTELTHVAIAPSSEYEVMYYRISNNPGVELPATGGPGTNLIYLIGLILAALSGAGLVISRSRRKQAA